MPKRVKRSRRPRSKVTRAVQRSNPRHRLPKHFKIGARHYTLVMHYSPRSIRRLRLGRKVLKALGHSSVVRRGTSIHTGPTTEFKGLYASGRLSDARRRQLESVIRNAR